MIKRYGLKRNPSISLRDHLLQDEQGDYVLYSDYQKLEKQLEYSEMASEAEAKRVDTLEKRITHIVKTNDAENERLRAALEDINAINEDLLVRDKIKAALEKSGDE